MLKSPLNYAGSKHDLMPQLLEYFPKVDSVEVFYDVFVWIICFCQYFIQENYI
jgi:site-specific DNA-adenine methylase